MPSRLGMSTSIRTTSGEQLGHPGDDLDAFGFSHSSTTPCLVTEWSSTTGHGLKSLYQLACSCALPPSDATSTVKYTDRGRLNRVQIHDRVRTSRATHPGPNLSPVPTPHKSHADVSSPCTVWPPPSRPTLDPFLRGEQCAWACTSCWLSRECVSAGRCKPTRSPGCAPQGPYSPATMGRSVRRSDRPSWTENRPTAGQQTRGWGSEY
jgi:hypothetical protein